MPPLDLAKLLSVGIHRASLPQLLGFCEEEQGKQTLPIGSAASRDPHELRPHIGLGVVQRGLDGGEWCGGFYTIDNIKVEVAMTLQHSDFKHWVVLIWRIRDQSSADLKIRPASPSGAKWAFSEWLINQVLVWIGQDPTGGRRCYRSRQISSEQILRSENNRT